MRKDIFLLSRQALVANKTRTALSMLGIVIGVLTIVLVIAVGKGVDIAIEDSFKTLSVDTLFVNPEGDNSQLEPESVHAIKQSPYVKEVTANLQGNFLVSSSLNTDKELYTVEGIDDNYLEYFGLEIDKGKVFSEKNNKQKVAILGSEVVEEFMNRQSMQEIIGSTLSIKGKKFTVIGILKESGVNIGPFSYDTTIYIPLKTAEKSLISAKGNTKISVIVSNIALMEATKEDVTLRLRDEFNLKEDDEDGFKLMDVGGVIGIALKISDIMSILLFAISGIVLVVSGIGIMNVMFAGVAERTKEIGILKSLGASKKVILVQFLLESILITTLSGVIGIILAEIIIQVAPIIVRSNGGDLLALGFSMSTGIFFGWYPARRASKLDPVDALRS